MNPHNNFRKAENTILCQLINGALRPVATFITSQLGNETNDRSELHFAETRMVLYKEKSLTGLLAAHSGR